MKHVLANTIARLVRESARREDSCSPRIEAYAGGIELLVVSVCWAEAGTRSCSAYRSYPQLRGSSSKLRPLRFVVSRETTEH